MTRNSVNPTTEITCKFHSFLPHRNSTVWAPDVILFLRTTEIELCLEAYAKHWRSKDFKWLRSVRNCKTATRGSSSPGLSITLYGGRRTCLNFPAQHAHGFDWKVEFETEEVHVLTKMDLVGGVGPEQPASADIQAICDGVRHSLYNKWFICYHALYDFVQRCDPL